MSSDVKTLLCAIDLSGMSQHVIAHALMEARAHDARIQIVHIMPAFDAAMAVPIVSFMGEKRFSELMNEKEEETVAIIRNKIDELYEGLKGKVPAEEKGRIEKVHVYEGDPVIEILTLAQEIGADMLVMGCHGKGISEHTFLGNVAHKVIKRAKVPVLLVPVVKP